MTEERSQVSVSFERIDQVPPAYANTVRVSGSGEEVLIEFVHVPRPSGQTLISAVPVAKLAVSYPTALRLFEALHRVIEPWQRAVNSVLGQQNESGSGENRTGQPGGAGEEPPAAEG